MKQLSEPPQKTAYPVGSTNVVDADCMENDPDYIRFVEEMSKDCSCYPPHSRPCDSLLAGGMCDQTPEPRECYHCAGRGYVLGEECDWCNGTGED